MVNAVDHLYQAYQELNGLRTSWRSGRRAGIGRGRDHVGRLMKLAGITGAVRERHHTVTTEREDPAPRRHPDLIGILDGSASLRPVVGGRLQLRGTCTASVLGRQVTASEHTVLVSVALERALSTRRRADYAFTSTGLVHHDEAKSPYSSPAFAEALLDPGAGGRTGTAGLAPAHSTRAPGCGFGHVIRHVLIRALAGARPRRTFSYGAASIVHA